MQTNKYLKREREKKIDKNLNLKTDQDFGKAP